MKLFSSVVLQTSNTSWGKRNKQEMFQISQNRWWCRKQSFINPVLNSLKSLFNIIMLTISLFAFLYSFCTTRNNANSNNMISYIQRIMILKNYLESVSTLCRKCYKTDSRNSNSCSKCIWKTMITIYHAFPLFPSLSHKHNISLIEQLLLILQGKQIQVPRHFWNKSMISMLHINR